MFKTPDTTSKVDKVITETVINGKKEILSKTITTIGTTWNSISKTNQRFMIGYLMTGLIYTTYESYNEGKSALIRYRNSSGIPVSEWDYVKKGCSNGAWNSLPGSFIWPVRIGASIMPHIILLFNPPPK